MRSIIRPSLAAVSLITLFAFAATASAESIDVTKQRRAKADDGSFKVVTSKETWRSDQTALIVCDMWDSHHCLNAVRRVQELSPQMNKVLIEARKRGATIIHAPSGCMKFYEDHPARRRARQAPKADNIPKDIGRWCYWKNDTEEQIGYPIDHSKGGEDDDPEEHAAWAKTLESQGKNPRAPWTRQIDVLEIDEDRDYISDSGVEIWNVCEQRGIKNVILVGVHTNMCVLGRPFGLRNMSRFGKNVVLMRDMTDAMYDPRQPPYVSHYRGTEMVVEHIEKHVCPTITSDQLLGGKPFVFAKAKSPRIVIAIAEKEYETKTFLPVWAKTFLREGKGYDVRILFEDEKIRDRIPGFGSALQDCDLLLLSVRRRALPKQDLDALRAYLKAGKPLVAIRTSSHAFDTRGKHPNGHDEWPKFDREVLGGHYQNHYGKGPTQTVTVAPAAADHPILSPFKGADKPYETSLSLYRSAPLAESATPLLYGVIPGKEPEPVAWTNTYGKSRIFYTSLADFTKPRFVTMLTEAVEWALGDKKR